LNRILVVDDEPQIRRMLKASLQSSGYTVVVASDGCEALTKFEMERPDLLVTDLAMPIMNGLELTQAIRRNASTPIIVLSVRDSDEMKVSALDEGADDYLTKPFSMPELLARVRAHLRRASEAPALANLLTVGDFLIDVEGHVAKIKGESVHLTPKEFDLLVLLARAPERVLTHRTLLRAIWGAAGENQPEYIRVLVAGLRKKVEGSGGTKYIVSEPWIGYRFEPQGYSGLTNS
jgi:two-component system KDP operon response regulator KdpE